ncbi:MlaD family protein [Desulfosediminicola flagellatus]|uniref:MlaD family protein n=1 Tax=Desulfosediminicola flagellatus TaxID=2569541 RepID=UPI0010AD7CFF|nr:MlaD family protein [Desulfosediminicola flagellatus]
MTNPTQSAPSPNIRRSRGISVIWTLPILALFICGWLFIESIRNAGIEITIYFDDAGGITESKTQVMSKGIPVGLVKALEPDIANNRVKATILMDKSLEPHLVSDTLFWIVRPEISASSIQGLETIITGSYIGIRAGSSGVKQRTYTAIASAPPIAADAPGLHLQLKAEELGSVQKETGIYFKNIEIGSVQNYSLTPDNSILIDIHIDEKYAGLVRTTSRFFNASGLTVSGKLPDLKLKLESLSSLLRGGILIHTPKELNSGPAAENGQTFQLYKDFEDASFGIPMTLQLASGAGIVEGSTKLMYRGIEAGFVKEIMINDDERKTVTARILLDPRAELILKKNTVFWLVKPAITPAGVDNLRTLLTGSHITFRPGDGEFTNHFSMLQEPPPQEPLRPGSYLQLRSENGVSLRAGAPVYFKEIQVGEVLDVGLAPDSTDVLTTIFVYAPYQHLVTLQSIFWIQTGIKVSADMSGLKVSTGPLARMLSGGIVFTTPKKTYTKTSDILVKNDHIFPLYKDYDQASTTSKALQPQGIEFQLQTKEPAGINVGTPILHRKLKIGHVTGLTFSPDQQSVLVDCFIAREHRKLLNSSTKFYSMSGVEVSGGLDGINVQLGSLEAILKGGIACITSPDSKQISPKSPLPLYTNIDQALHAEDRLIKVTFKSAGNLRVGSAVRYKGITAGKVTGISFNQEMESVSVTFRVENSIVPLFKSTTRIWQVEPEVSLSGVNNLDTVIFGSYLTFLPGAGKPTFEFTGLDSKPQTPYNQKEGLPLILESTHLSSLSVGSPLYYREMQVGEVTGFELSPSFQQVYVFCIIEPKYAPIIRENTKFWNISGVKVKGGLLTGMTLATGSVDSILKGGISLATPNNSEAGLGIAPGTHFALHDSAEPGWLDWNPDIILIGN